ncbi:MAG: hydroxymethylglutaryl-CoA reductase [Gammaproteobacteria bacterium RIFCSPHIGHO2_12_FULL_35_23]|nr:MAG: hydroxymethylglutaryl-CoA reductase [Gammaproteobacteria bacterium RIFCSPHIGHO2_12_FULL_35_23]
MKAIGPIKIVGPVVNEEVLVPLATYEIPVWPSTNRGAKVSRESGGIFTTLIDERMTRSFAVEASNAAQALIVASQLKARKAELETVVAGCSRFAKLVDLHFQVVGKILYVRFEFTTGDAAGHNMVTKATEQLLYWTEQQYPALRYVSVSSNYCIDKKVSAVNGILGRGKYVVTEIIIPREVCQKTLKTTPEKIVELNTKKNLLGSIIAGSLRSANAHFANVLLAFYLATGQDAANIVEGSQGFTFAEMQGDAVYFSATLPNIIVGTIGNGKDLPFVQENLQLLGCLQARETGDNSRRLAVICAAAVMCCELSLIAALTNPSELMRAHVAFERNQSEVK